MFIVFLYYFEVWVQRCPRVVPGSLPGSLQVQNWSKMGFKMTPKSSTNVVRRLSENVSQRHAHWACFQIALGFFLVCSYSCRGRFCFTFIQVKSRHSSTWLGGKTYGGCLQDASQMSPRCFSDVFKLSARCFSDAFLPDVIKNLWWVSRAAVMLSVCVLSFVLVWCFVFLVISCVYDTL